MEGTGKIIAVKNDRATVLVRKSSACGHDCGECNLCSNPEITVEILNPINAVPGDMVVIGIPTSKVLLWTFVLYILPLIGAMAIYAVLSVIVTYGVIKFAGVFLWIVLWFVYVRNYSKRRIVMSSALEVINEEN